MAHSGLSMSKIALKAITQSYENDFLKTLTEEARLQYKRSCKSAEERLGNREEPDKYDTTKEKQNGELLYERECIEGLINNFDQTALQGKYASFFKRVKFHYLKLNLDDLRQVGMLLEGIIKPFSDDI
jgi:hypothetical protein